MNISHSNQSDEHGSSDSKENTHDEHNGEKSHHEKMAEDFKNRSIVTAIATVPILIFSPTIQDLLGFTAEFSGVEYLLLLLSTGIFIYGGYPFFEGFLDELEDRQPGMMTLVTLAISVSYFYSGAVVLVIDEGKFFFWELATLILVMLIGHWIEMRSVSGASQALEELAKLVPTDAHLVVDDDSTKDVKTSELEPGDVVIVRPGEKIPTDGKIIKGETSVNESLITGESKPISKEVDDEVIGGSVNGEGSIRVKVEKTGEESYLSQVMNLVEEAQKSRSKTQDLANRAAFYLTILAISIGLITLLAWISIGEQDFLFALERMVTVMVITCPHALGLAIPLVVAVSTSLSAKNGVLIRNRQRFEQARNIDKIIFDKTGTLTKGEFGITDLVTFGEKNESKILQIAATLESESEHSIARGIVNSAESKEIELLKLDNFQAIPGKGIEGKVNDKNYKVVSPNYLDNMGLTYDRERIEKLHHEGKTVVFLIDDNSVLGAIALADIIREESKETINRLISMGIEPIMLTGDNEQVAKYVAGQLGIESYYAEVLPDEKSEIVKKVQAEGVTVAMVGDGVNDAPALVQSDIGMAIGAGTDVAIESADIILVKDNPQDTIDAINLSRSTYGKMKQNLFWATGYNAFAIPLAAGVLYNLGIILSPAVGAGLMSLSTVIVAINSKFLSMN